MSEWQTSKIQILVWVTTCGFKSHFPHTFEQRQNHWGTFLPEGAPLIFVSQIFTLKRHAFWLCRFFFPLSFQLYSQSDNQYQWKYSRSKQSHFEIPAKHIRNISYHCRTDRSA